MKRLLRSELIKLRTTRTFYALAGVAIGLSLLLTVLTASIGTTTKDNVLDDVFQNDVSTLFIMILAIVGITGEWRHRTITSSLLAAPDRVRFLGAKTLAFAAAGALLSLAISIAVAIVAYAILGARDQPTPPLGDVIELMGRNVGVAALLGAFGVGVGSLLRNQAVAIVGILILGFVVDSLLGEFAPGVEVFSPTGALPNAIQGVDPSDVGMSKVDFLAAIPALGAMLVWIGALFGAGGALLVRRDVE
jgi:ABC-type transport system involved in multi-copper enzyme maturation permease subunit